MVPMGPMVCPLPWSLRIPRNQGKRGKFWLGKQVVRMFAMLAPALVPDLITSVQSTPIIITIIVIMTSFVLTSFLVRSKIQLRMLSLLCLIYNHYGFHYFLFCTQRRWSRCRNVWWINNDDGHSKWSSSSPLPPQFLTDRRSPIPIEWNLFPC